MTLFLKEFRFRLDCIETILWVKTISSEKRKNC